MRKLEKSLARKKYRSKDIRSMQMSKLMTFILDKSINVLDIVLAITDFSTKI